MTLFTDFFSFVSVSTAIHKSTMMHAYDTANAGAGVLMYKPDVLHLVYKQRKAHTHAS